jgi:hypothetical protein
MRRGLRFAALGYLALLLLIPVGLVIYRTFEPGVGAVWDSVTTPAAISAFWLTLEIAAISVALNTVLGVLTALLLVRGRLRGKWIIEALLDLPFAVSPVVVGLSLVLVYGRGGWLADLPVQVIFALPGMVLATVFVSLPFVAREVIPVLREVGDERAGRLIANHGADRHAKLDVATGTPVFVGARAPAAVFRAVDARIAVIDERIDIAIGPRPDAAAAAAVAAIGSAARHVLLAPKARHAVAAAAGMNFDLRLVDELHAARATNKKAPPRW